MFEAPNTSLDELMFDYLAFVMQDLKRQEERQVSRQRVLVLVLVQIHALPSMRLCMYVRMHVS